MSVFNRSVVDHHAEPMFLGSDTGVARYDDPKHAKFEKLTEKQLSFFWRPEEVDVSKDRVQFQKMSENDQDIFTNNLKYQTLLDSVQGRAPAIAFADICSDVGLETWIQTWTFSETIHSRSYTHIMRNVYTDPAKEFETIVLNPAIMKRAEAVSKYYDDLDNRKFEYNYILRNIADHTEEQLARAKYKLMCAIYLCMHSVNALEAIRFYVSFACTFNFHKNHEGIMEGNSKIMKFIARDEQLHLQGTQYIVKYLQSGAEGPEWQKVTIDCEAEAAKIFLDAAAQEKEWIDYLFRNGTTRGLNHEMLYNFVDYLTYSRMNDAGLPHDLKPQRHPIPWVRHYLNTEAVQVAPQEVELSNYLTGQIDQDVEDDDFQQFNRYL
ncbi:ribonucleoside diphosphate reductase beta subunit [Serratia phage SP1]|nr:ribonucleoside diphosphate reductase beta subunit [Serratia phage SP1]